MVTFGNIFDVYEIVIIDYEVRSNKINDDEITLMRKYIHKIHQCSQLTNMDISIYVYSLLILDNYLQTNEQIPIISYDKYIVACILLSYKFNVDRCIRNNMFAKLFDQDHNVINKIEMMILEKLNFSIYYNKNIFNDILIRINEKLGQITSSCHVFIDH